MTTRFAPRNLQGLPTLTEVIEIGAPEAAAAPAAAEVAVAGPSDAKTPAGPSHADGDARAEPALDEDRLVGDVLVELQRHADLMLEYRLREAVEPVLARLADGLVRELREEVAATLRDVIARAVSQELARQRGRQS